MKKLITILSILLGLVSVRAVAQAPNPNIFLIEDGAHTWSGTAFQLQTKHGTVVITNSHVCNAQNEMFVRIPGSANRKILVVKKYSIKYDLCELSPVYGIPGMAIGNDYHFFEWAVVDGFPRGKRRVTIGIVGPVYIAPDGHVTKIPTVEYSGAVDFGSSGSPVVDENGYVIGVICIKFDGTDKGAFIPLEYLKDFLEE
jgi:S1-C subfamily serine protease